MAEIDTEKILVIVATITASFVLVVFVIISVILDHHWKKYIIDFIQIQKIRTFYFGISLALIILMFLTLLAMLL